MADQVEIQIPKTVVEEESNFPATAYYLAANAAVTPTTVHYRVDCLTTKTTLQGWTQVGTPGTSNEITITKAMNAIQQNSSIRERKQLIVQTDRGTSTQATGSVKWFVKNLYGININ